MANLNILMLLCVLHVSTSQWAADWMTPVQEQFEESAAQKNSASGSLKQFEDDYEKMVPANRDSRETELRPRTNEPSASGIKAQLETTLANAKDLAETLRAQIMEVSSRETRLKEAITSGRSGITTVTVSTMGQSPRSYIIREGMWTLCTGIVQSPSAAASRNGFNGLFSTPRCFGQEVPTRQDPCVFNSIIKYETVPTQRRLLYTEDDYLCLKNSFNTTLEQYLSVPRRIINDTCGNGVVRSLEDNQLQCGVRVLSEYAYYPHRSLATSLPLEYCTEGQGACKLLVAWHISNATVENFEFLKDEQNFKKYFMKNSFSDSMFSM